MKTSVKRSVSNPALLGRAIARARRQAGLTQKELCRQTGVAYSTLTKIERGVIKRPNAFIVLQIAQATGLNVEELLNVPPVSSSPHPPTDVARPEIAQDQTAPKPSVEFIYFDLHQVLVNSMTDVFFVTMAAQTGHSQEKLIDLCRQRDIDLCLGKISVEDFDAIMAEKLDYPGFAFLDFYKAHARANPDVLAVFDLVAQKHRVGLLTNAWKGNVKALIEAGIIPSRYDVIVDSSEVGLAKPNREIFKYAQGQAQLPPHKILLVDDRAINIQAARGCGWQALAFDCARDDLRAGLQTILEL